MDPQGPRYYNFKSEYLKDFTTQVFMHFGIAKDDAMLAAGVL